MPFGGESSRTIADTLVAGHYPHALHILVADDDAFNREMSTDSLKRHFGNAVVHCVGDGRQAVELMALHDFDLVLMDMQMPVMNGIEATRYIREQLKGHNRLVPIIALTATIMEEEIREVLASGMNAYLAKPYQPGALAQIIADTLQLSAQTETGPNANETINNLEVDGDQSRFDLAFLRDFCGNDEDQMQYFLEKFKNQWPVEMDRLKTALEAEDREAIAKAAHRFRPQLDFVGLKHDAALVFKLEQLARDERSFNEIQSIFSLLKGWQ